MTTATEHRIRYESGLHTLPPSVTAAVRAYIEDGAEPDGYYGAAIRYGWDSEAAWKKVDIADRIAMDFGVWEDWFADFQPPESFGSNAKVRKWLAHAGLSGMEG